MRIWIFVNNKSRSRKETAFLADTSLTALLRIKLGPPDVLHILYEVELQDKRMAAHADARVEGSKAILHEAVRNAHVGIYARKVIPEAHIGHDGTPQ